MDWVHGHREWAAAPDLTSARASGCFNPVTLARHADQTSLTRVSHCLAGMPPFELAKGLGASQDGGSSKER